MKALALVGLLLGQWWQPIPDPKTILSGNWQSCRQIDGDYPERAYDYCVLGECQWSFHMGGSDFALFKVEPEDDDHDSPLNLLVDHRIDTSWSVRPKRTWFVKSLHLKVFVTQAGGSREDCESWNITITSTRP